MSGLKSPAPTVAQLKTSLISLQSALNPILTQSLEQLTTSIEEGNQDGKLQSAQIYVSMAYVILDLVWILLKVSGIDTVSHPVTNELKRVSEYLHKVHRLSHGDEKEEMVNNAPPIDKSKVGRFLRHALGTPAQGKRKVFAEDGTVQEVVRAGEDKDEVMEKGDERLPESITTTEEEESASSSKRTKKHLLKAEKALKKVSDAMSSSKKKHRK